MSRVAARVAASIATYAATDHATRAATYAAIDAATRAATRDMASAAADHAPNDRVVRLFLLAMSRWSYLYNGGNQWASWCSFLSFFRDVAKLALPQYELYEHYEIAAIHAGPRYMHARFWIVCDFPSSVRRDARNRAHCATGPALTWRDGWAVYYWHGTQIPASWIERPETLTAVVALGQQNVELRRCACEIVGWNTILESLPHRVLDADADPEIGTLISVDLPDAPDTRYVRARCGTGRTVYYRASDAASTALEAVADSYGLAPHEYKPEVRT
jgi:hypothetical protein